MSRAPHSRPRAIHPAVHGLRGLQVARTHERRGRWERCLGSDRDQEGTGPPPPPGEDAPLGHAYVEPGPPGRALGTSDHDLDAAGVPAQAGLQHLQRALLRRPDQVGCDVALGGGLSGDVLLLGGGEEVGHETRLTGARRSRGRSPPCPEPLRPGRSPSRLGR